MISRVAVAVVLASIAALAHGAIDADQVKVLPGWDGALPSKHYSGLIPVGKDSGTTPGHLHYWFIESENNPATDPVVLWLNGGPGSSSLIGLLTENGQLVLNDDSLTNKTREGVPRLFYNPQGWTRIANVVFLESPKGVGFSYCDQGTSSCRNSDETTAKDSHEFLVRFFAGFSEYKNNDFYITGESYAGVYIPMLIDQIDKQGQIKNFKGAAIGNGCWGADCFYGVTETEIDYHIYAGHAFISQTLIATIDKECGDFSHRSQACKSALNKMDKEADNFNVYNIYDVCAHDQEVTGLGLSDIRAIIRNGTHLREPKDSYHVHPQLAGALNDYKCGASTAMDKFLDDRSVMAALHVKADSGGMRYSSDCGDLRTLYKSLFQKHRIMIYSGDVDGCVPYWGSEKWTREMGFQLKTDWHAWKSDSSAHKGNVVAGYAMSYEHLDFVTIKGAGHMVPQFKPVFAFTMFKKFLANQPF